MPELDANTDAVPFRRMTSTVAGSLKTSRTSATTILSTIFESTWLKAAPNMFQGWFLSPCAALKRHMTIGISKIERATHSILATNKVVTPS